MTAPAAAPDRSLPRRLARVPVAIAARAWRRGREAAVYTRSLVPGDGPETRFFLYGDGRVGSELLVDLLDSHPRVLCESEVLHFPVRWPRRYVEGRARRAASRGAEAYGFKLLNYQLRQLRATAGPREPARLLAEWVADGWRLVHMKRENVLRQAASALVSRYRKEWHTEKDGAPLTGKIPLDTAELLRIMEGIERDVSADERAIADLPHLTIVYERDLLDGDQHEGTARRVFEHLGLPPSEVETKWAKVTPKRMDDFVANYDEVRRAVAATPFARFLEEPA